MQDEGKSKEQLIIELQTLRKRVAEAENYIAEIKRREAALTESEQRFKLLYERTPLAYQSLDENGDFIEVNQAWLEALGYPKQEVIGRNFADFLPPDWANHFEENFPRFKALGEVLGVEFEMVKKDGSTMLVSFHGKIGRDSQGRFKQTHCIFQDITERAGQAREIEHLNRLYTVLSRVSQAVVRATSPETFLEQTCREVVEGGHFLLAWIGQVDSSTNAVVPTAFRGRIGEYLQGIKVYADDRPEGRGPTGTCLREGRPSVHNDFLHNPVTLPWRARAAPFGIASCAAFPIKRAGRPWGALSIYSDEVGRFSDQDAKLLQQVARDIEFALDNLDREFLRKQAEEALRKSEREKTVMNQIANVFLEVSDEKIYEEVLNVILESYKCRYGIFGYIGDTGDLIIPTLTRGVWSECRVEEKSIVFPSHVWGNSIWGKAVTERKAFLSEGPFRTPKGHVPIDNFLTVPILFNNVSIGLISLANKDGGFIAEDKAFLEQIAGSISPILHTRMQRDRQELERKRAELLLQRQAELLHLSHDAIIVWRLGGCIETWNKGAEELYSYSPEEAVGQVTHDLLKAVHPEPWIRIEARLREHKSWEGELKHRTREGREVIVSGRLQLVNGADGVERVLEINRDITDHKSVEEALHESERKFHSIFDSMSEMVVLHELICDSTGRPVDYRILDCNPAFTYSTGIPAERAIGALASRLYGAGEPPYLESYAHVTQSGQPMQMDVYFAPMQKYFSMSVVSPAQGIFATVTTDITERKQAEEALRRSEERYKNISGSVSDFVFSSIKPAGGDYEIDWLAGGVERITGYSIQEVLDRRCWKFFVHHEDMSIFDESVRGVQPGGSGQCELRIVHKDGSIRWIRAASSVAPGKGLIEPHRMFGSCEDITARKLAEEKLRETSLRLNFATASAKAGVWDFNLQTGEMIWDDRMFELYGLTRENFPGAVEAWKQGLHPDDSSRAIEEYQAALNGQRNFDTKFRIRRPDGTVVHLKADALVLRDEEGKPLRMIGLNIDITEREQAEENLIESERRYRALFENMTSGFVLFEAVQDDRGVPVDLVILSANKGFETATGLKTSEVAGKRLTQVLPGIDKDAADWIGTYGKVAMTGEPRQFEQGSELLGAFYSITAYQAGPKLCSVTFQDISERKRAEGEREKLRAQLNQAQKMESVGRLAGGVAHDFNNMLGVILGHSEIAMDQLDPAQPLHADLQEIHEAAKRSADLTRQLLAFARKQTVLPKVLDLNETVEGMLKMLRRLIGEDIDLAWLPENNLWPLKVDPSQIDQILANLCVNARDAIAGNGKITIETENVVYDEAYCARHEGTLPGDYVLLVVSDNGCGMDEETQAKLFEPFFTTKELGKGTGLGLATVYGIVKQNNGFINIYSEPGYGTTFKVYLPRYFAKAGRKSKTGAAAPIGRGHETILLVEDEPAMLAMTTMMLERQGYTVLQAGTPGEAIRLAEAHPGELSLLVTDVVMPEMNGRELAKNILSLYPGLKRLFMSGYTSNVIAHHGVLDEGVNFLQKPFSMQNLAAKVRQALGEGTAE